MDGQASFVADLAALKGGEGSTSVPASQLLTRSDTLKRFTRPSLTQESRIPGSMDFETFGAH